MPKPASLPGISLIELAAVCVLGLALGIVAVPKLAALPAQQRDTQRKSDLKSVRVALESYYQQHFEYPAASYSQLGGVLSNSIASIPQSPSGDAYVYRATKCSPGCQGFELWAQLENSDDPGISIGPDRYVVSR